MTATTCFGVGTVVPGKLLILSFEIASKVKIWGS